MVGNAVDAKIAYNRYHNDIRVKGWREIGSGSTRTAYLSPAKVVYKVGDTYNNLTESRESRRLRNSALLARLNIAVPRARCWRVNSEEYVIAQEYIRSEKIVDCAKAAVIKPKNTKCTCNPTPNRMCYADMFDLLHDNGIYDMFRSNMRYQNGKYYIIDLGGQDDYSSNG